jgi:hypothetical protein
MFRKKCRPGKEARRKHLKAQARRKRQSKAIQRGEAELAKAQTELQESKLQLEVHKVAAQVAATFLAEAAPGLAGYELLTFTEEHASHAKEVKASRLHDESVARKCDGYSKLAPGTACLLKEAFVLANLRNDGYLSGTLLYSANSVVDHC